MKYAVLAFVLGLLINSASAGYNFYVVNCDTLKGSGAVVLWFDDLRYEVPIECK